MLDTEFSLLTVECGFYLPAFHTINVWFLKEIMAKRKKAIKNKDMQWLYAPQYETLSREKMLDWGFEHGNIGEYFPEERDLELLPRQVSDLQVLLLFDSETLTNLWL